MADNTTLNSGSGGDTMRTKDRSGVKTQIVGLDLNPGGGSETLAAGGIPITSHVPGTGATNLGKAEDAAAVSGDTGVAVLAVRRDSASAGVDADGDYAHLSLDSTGALRISGPLNQEYTEGDIDSTITGQAMLWEDTGDTLRAVSVAKPLPVSAVNVAAADATSDDVAAVPVTGGIASLGSPNVVLTPKFAKITASSSGATQVVALVSGKKIRVLQWNLVCNAAVNVKWQSHTTPTDLTGLHYFAANGGLASGFSPLGHFETVSGEALDINLSGAVAVGGSLVYVEV